MSWPAIAAAPAKNAVRQKILPGWQLLAHLFVSSKARYLALRNVKNKDLTVRSNN